MKRFEGIYAVMLTAYDDYGNIDREAMRLPGPHLMGSAPMNRITNVSG